MLIGRYRAEWARPNFSVGVDHCDLEAAKRKGIIVTNTPDVLTDATAELTILLMLGAARRASEGERLIRSGNWTTWSPAFMVGTQVTGKRLGIVGRVDENASLGDMTANWIPENRAQIDRLIDAFPAEEQNQIRTMLAETLKGVCAQLLMPTKDNKGRVPVNEILTGSFALRSIIREGSVAKIVSLIESGRGAGMQLMDDAIWNALQAGKISGEIAHLFASQKQRFERFVKSA